MNQRQTDWSLDDINRGTVLTAAVLLGAGSLLGIAGLAIACSALAGAGARWYSRVDLPPQEIAKLKWQQAKAAANAGAGAWQEVESTSYVPRSGRAQS